MSSHIKTDGNAIEVPADRRIKLRWAASSRLA